VKEEAEVCLKRKFEMYKALEYQTQIVAGINYRIIVRELIYVYSHVNLCVLSYS